MLSFAVMMNGSRAALEAEAHAFGRYLVGGMPAPEIVARYCDASSALWPAPPTARDAALLAYIRRHPWSVGPLDAAAAVLDPGGVFRGKILVASAILETTTAHADDFLPLTVSVPALLWRLVASGVAAATYAAVGLALWGLARHPRA